MNIKNRIQGYKTYFQFQQYAVGDTWRIIAQNGPTELKGNLMQSCAWHLIRDQDLIVKTLYCIENSADPTSEILFKGVRYALFQWFGQVINKTLHFKSSIS